MKKITSIMLTVLLMISGCAPQNAGKELPEISASLSESSSSEPSEQPVELESTDASAHRESKPLEKIPAEQLAETEPVCAAAGLDIYLRNENGSIIVPQPYEPPLPYDDQRKTGDVIAARPGEDGYILGQYDTDKDQWGTLSPLGNGLVCFNNYQELRLIDTDNWTDTDIALDFQTPSEPNHRISSVARDHDTGEFVVIYQVSSYTVSPDGEKRPWLAYDNSDIGAQDAHMQFQRFDSEGKFLGKIVTDREPRGMNDVADCLPNRYRDGKITFLQKDYMGFLVTCDLATGEIATLDCSGAFLTEGAELMYDYEYREDIPGAQFTYRWYEQGEEVASLTLEEERDTLTMAFEHMPEPLTLSRIDPENCTAELTYQGLIFHKLDFDAGTAEIAYEYPEDRLGDLLLTSPDGRYQICRLSLFSGGEAAFEDIVAKDTETGEFIRLGSLNNVGDMTITGDNQLVAPYYDRLEVCRLSDGEWYEPMKKFESVETAEELKYRPLEILYDAENLWILVLYADYFDPFLDGFTEEMAGTMKLDVYEEDWTLVRSIDTGITPPFSLKAYGAYSPGLILEEPGRLRLVENNTVVDYLE